MKQRNSEDRNLSKDKLLSAYGDGWYDGFLAAKALAEKHDLYDYNNDQIMNMSEHAESESQIAKLVKE